jgi:hypothetical protein
MKRLSGWFATIGLSGVLVAVAVLAIGGGAVALHQSTLLTRPQPIPVAIQPVSASSPSPSVQATPDDHGVHATGAPFAATPSASPSVDDRGRGRGSDDGNGHK